MRKIVYAALLLSACLWVGQVRAEEPSKLVGTFGAWRVYSFIDNNEKVCFIAAHPQKQAGKFKKRDEVQFFVTRWAGDKDKNVVSISNGYVFKLDSAAVVTLGDKTYKLFTQGEMAWSKNQSMDNDITSALQKGGVMKVEGTSTRGTSIADTYDLKDAAAAYQAFTAECEKK